MLDGFAVAHHFNDIMRFKLFAELRVDQTMDVLRKFFRSLSQGCLVGRFEGIFTLLTGFQ